MFTQPITSVTEMQIVSLLYFLLWQSFQAISQWSQFCSHLKLYQKVFAMKIKMNIKVIQEILILTASNDAKAVQVWYVFVLTLKSYSPLIGFKCINNSFCYEICQENIKLLQNSMNVFKISVILWVL